MDHRNFLWLPVYGRHGRYLAFILALFSPWSTAVYGTTPSQVLTLPQAISRALDKHPDLSLFEYRFKAVSGAALNADQAPAYELGLEFENLLGSGALNGVDAAEYTLALSSVIELGDKRQSRKRLASEQHALVEAERTAEALKLLGRVTRAFIRALSLQEKIRLGETSVALAESSRETIKQRVERGATPEAEDLRAKVLLAQRRLELETLKSQFDAALVELATLFGEETPAFTTLEGEIYAFATVPDFAALFQRASENPAIAILASEARVREAELELIRSQSRSDINWRLGIRHLEESSDSALVAGFSLPLGSAHRNRGQVQSGHAALAETGLRRDSALLTLRAGLYHAWRQYQQGVAAVRTLQEHIIPDLERALALTRAAYLRGRYRYIEWQAAQNDLLSAQQTLVESASAALLNQALIEQLTGQPLIARDL